VEPSDKVKELRNFLALASASAPRFPGVAAALDVTGRAVELLADLDRRVRELESKSTERG
jgi:hypothetical protein